MSYDQPQPDEKEASLEGESSAIESHTEEEEHLPSLEEHLGKDLSKLTSETIGVIKMELLNRMRNGDISSAHEFMVRRKGRSVIDQFYQSPEWIESEKEGFRSLVESEGGEIFASLRKSPELFRYLEGEDGKDIRKTLAIKALEEGDQYAMGHVMARLEDEDIRDNDIKESVAAFVGKSLLFTSDSKGSFYAAVDLMGQFELTDEQKTQIVSRNLNNAHSLDNLQERVSRIDEIGFSDSVDSEMFKQIEEEVFRKDVHGYPKGAAKFLQKREEFIPIMEEEILKMPGNQISSFSASQEVFANALGREIAVPWSETIAQMEKEHSRGNADGEYDTWKTDLDPLVKGAVEEGVISPESSEDGEHLLDYLRSHGMVNMPTIFSWHVEMKKNGDLKKLPEELRSEIEDELGVSIEKMPNIGFVTKEIQKRRSEILTGLLNDDVPEYVINTKIGRELFRSIVGASEFERGEDPAELLKLWLSTTESRPEVTELPERYEEFEFAVSGRRSVETSVDEAIANKVDSVLDNPDLQKATSLAAKAHSEGMNIEDVSEWWQGEKHGLIYNLNGKILDLEHKLAEAPNERARAGMEARKKKLEEKQARIETMIPETEDGAGVELMNALSEIADKNDPAISAILRKLSAKDMVDKMPEGVRYTLATALGGAHRMSRKSVAAWEKYLKGYVAEHYLNPNPEGHLSEGDGLSPAARKKLGLVWGLGGSIGENPIMRSESQLRELEQGNYRDAGTKEVSMIPAKGAMRIFAGDVGDACYTSEHDNLAKGEYENLSSFLYVTGRGTENERIQGSVLVIEAKEENGELALLVRANNPRKSLLTQVDQKALLDSVMDGMKELAERRGAKKVLVPYDYARSSVSNRDEVADWVKESIPDPTFVRLESTPETNFNGYQNWNNQEDPDDEGNINFHPSAVFFDLEKET